MFKYFFSYLKIIFYIANIILITLYVFPGSILGWFIYGNVGLQPQITSDFIVSSNHVYAFMVLSFLGYFSYENHRLNFLFLYLFSISIFLELLHIIIPNRGFEFPDLFGNILGVLVVYLFCQIFNFFKIQKMKIKNFNKIIILTFFLLSACSSIPKNASNSCSIFDERYFWYKYAKKTEQKWGTPIYIQLAIIKMESDFDWLAKPPRQKIFKVIPFKRPSSSFGYSQAVKGTWEQYKKETGNKLATRVRFKDSVDFIGWYTNKTESILKISKQDAFRQYIAYHEGWGNFKYYKKNKKVINLAKKVEKQSHIYKKQLSKCKNSLNKNKYIIF